MKYVSMNYTLDLKSMNWADKKHSLTRLNLGFKSALYLYLKVHRNLGYTDEELLEGFKSTLMGYKPALEQVDSDYKELPEYVSIYPHMKYLNVVSIKDFDHIKDKVKLMSSHQEYRVLKRYVNGEEEMYAVYDTFELYSSKKQHCPFVRRVSNWFEPKDTIFWFNTFMKTEDGKVDPMSPFEIYLQSITCTQPLNNILEIRRQPNATHFILKDPDVQAVPRYAISPTDYVNLCHWDISKGLLSLNQLQEATSSTYIRQSESIWEVGKDGYITHQGQNLMPFKEGEHVLTELGRRYNLNT